jgi:hypothetical protein
MTLEMWLTCFLGRYLATELGNQIQAIVTDGTRSS